MKANQLPSLELSRESRYNLHFTFPLYFAETKVSFGMPDGVLDIKYFR